MRTTCGKPCRAIKRLFLWMERLSIHLSHWGCPYYPAKHAFLSREQATREKARKSMGPHGKIINTIMRRSDNHRSSRATKQSVTSSPFYTAGLIYHYRFARTPPPSSPQFLCRLDQKRSPFLSNQVLSFQFYITNHYHGRSTPLLCFTP